MWDECNCAVICNFFGTAFLHDWNENWPFPVLWALLSFPNLLAYWVQHFLTPSLHGKIDGGNNGNSDRLYFLGVQNHCRWWLQPWNYTMLVPCKKSYDKPRQHIKKQRLYLLSKVHILKAMTFPVVMYGCDSWTIKKAKCWIIDAFEVSSWRRLLRAPWTARRSNQSGNQSWIFVGRTDAESDTPTLWLHDAESWPIKKVPDAGKDWRQEEKGTTGWDSWKAPPTWWTWVSKLHELVMDKVSWHVAVHGSQRVGHDWAEWTVLSLFTCSGKMQTKIFM